MLYQRVLRVEELNPMDEKEKDWPEEEKRVELVVRQVKKSIKKLSKYAKTLKNRVIDIRKDFWDDVTVNLSEMDDIIETQASLKQQAEFLSERERSHGQLSKQLDKLERMRDTPYFGRIDFVENDQNVYDSIYIGTTSLMDEQENEFLVYDWRAPIASLYYDYPPGPAKYQAIDEEIEGEITLKRQYVIRQGELKGMFDTGLTIGDHLLQSVLGKSADTQMKSIVATIQQEQNKIIRNERSKMLVVQGVAGSGKTSAALQRVAYLLYRYREQLTSDQIILFSPNPLFNSYVSTVLPELGEDNMKQTTFYHYIEQQLGNRFVIESPFDQIEYYLQKNGELKDPRIASMSFKASLAFKEQVDHLLEKLKRDGMTFRNVRFRGDLIVGKEKIRNYFYALPSSLSIPVRLEKVMQWLLKELKKLEKTEEMADWVLEETQLLDKDDYQEAFQSLEEEYAYQSDVFDDRNREEAILRKKVIKQKLHPLRKKIKRFHFFDVKNTYIQLFSNQTDQHDVFPNHWDLMCQDTKTNIRENFLTWEDATPFLYFERMCIGFHENRSIQHIFVDEAQDYSVFQLAYLQKVYPNSRMTLLGDINQAIYLHSLEDVNPLSPEEKGGQERITLLRSYRSTRPIVEFTKSWMPNGEKIESFHRSGRLPDVIEVDNRDIALDKVITAMENDQQNDYKTIAVITKTMKESRSLYQQLKSSFPEVTLIDFDTHTYQKGFNVIPAYLAKGIEFDSVIVWDASREQYQDELERNLLYTACTRAMHELTVISIGELSDYIRKAPRETFTSYKVHAIEKQK